MNACGPVTGIVLASGQSRRMEGVDKLNIRLGDKPVLAWSLCALDACPEIDRIIAVARPDSVEDVRALAARSVCNTPFIVIEGGARRQDSVYNALIHAQESAAVVIHDGARPLVSQAVIEKCLLSALRRKTGIAGVRSKDTIKRVSTDGVVLKTLERDELWNVQTPQAFEYDLLLRAHKAAQRDGFLGTDDSVLVERIGEPVHMVEADDRNLKITTPADIAIFNALIQRRADAVRVGIGYDSHSFTKGRPLILGGVEIAHEYGLKGHSDADVVVHAVMDALLGAAALGNKGIHFPDTDERNAGADSIKFLEQVRDLLSSNGAAPTNVDVMIIAQKPRIAPYVCAMRARVAAALKIEEGLISIKATTNEGMGFVGRGEGICVLCTAVIATV